jgi:tetratricopeptide (TPR) repeat protein
VGAVLCAWLSCAAIAHADAPNAPTAEDKKVASVAFREGDRAFNAGDYRRAAESYELAYARAPHYAPLWNAARAWDRAGEMPRAANLYAKYLREAPADAPDRNNATSALAKIAPKLARLDIHADAGVSAVKIDDRAAEPDADGGQTYTVYVVPGAHVIEARVGDETIRQSPSVAAGDHVGVALAPAAKKIDAPPTPIASPAPEPPPSSRGWSPVVVVFGGAVTAITAGLAIWSGVDTLNQKDQFDKAPTQDNLDSGRAKQTRTNALIAASAVAGVLTGAAAIFLVDWKGSASHVEVGLGPGTVAVRGSF